MADEIRNTLALYCQHSDDARVDELVALFAAEGVFSAPGTEIRGREALREMFAGQLPAHGRHVTLNTVVNRDGERAHCVSDMFFISLPDNTIRVVGRYDDELVLNDGRWLIARRDFQMITPA